MNNEYIIINKTQLLKRIEELSFIGKSQGLTEHQFAEKSIIENIVSQSTPLIPEIEKAFDEGSSAHSNSQDWNHPTTFDQDKQDYISNLKIDI